MVSLGKIVKKIMGEVVYWAVTIIIALVGVLITNIVVTNILEGDSVVKGLTPTELVTDYKERKSLYLEGDSEDRIDLVLSKTDEEAYQKVKGYRSKNGGLHPMDYFTFKPYVEMSSEEILALYESMDYEVLNNEFGKVINEHRASLGLNELEFFGEYQEGTKHIAKELADYGFITPKGQDSHTLPNGEVTLTVFEEIDEMLYYRGLGENLAFTYTYNNPYTLRSERYLAEQMFDIWMGSTTGHRELMESEGYSGFSFAVYPVTEGNTMRAKDSINGRYSGYEEVRKRDGIGIMGVLTMILLPEL